MKINFSLLKTEFKEYLEDMGISLNHDGEEDISSASIFEYSEEFKDFVNEKYDIDLNEDMINMSELSGAEVSSGKFVVDEENEVGDEAAIVMEVLNGMFADEDFIKKLDTTQDGSLDGDEIKDFLSFSREKSEDGKNLSFDDIKNSILDVNDGKYDIDDDVVGDVEQTSSSTPSSSTPSNGNRTPSTPSGSQTQDDKKDYSKMNLDELKSAQDEKKNEINSQSQKINSTITQNEQNVAQAKEAYDSAVAQDNINPELLQSRENNLNAITQNETQINELNKNINNFDTQITSCDSQLSAIESNIAALNSALGSLSSAPADDPELQAQIAAKREAINGQITALTAQQNELKATKAQLEQQKQQAQSSLDEATSKMQELESEKQTIDENILATCNEQTKQTLEAYNKAREAANTALKAEQDAMNTKKQELASIEQHLNAKNAKQIENQYGYKEKADIFGDTGGYWWDDTDTSTNMKYGVITPNNVNPNEKLPVILYLHGAGSMGNLQRVENGFFNETFADYQMENFNGYIICPSLNRGSWEHESVATDLDEILNSFSKTHNIDPDNIVIAGHSLGGSGVLYMTQQERFKDDDGFKFKKAAVLTGYPDGKEYTDFDMPVGLWVDHGSYKGLDRYVGKYLDYENGDIRVDYTKVRHDKVDNTAFVQDSDGDGRADLIEWLFDED